MKIINYDEQPEGGFCIGIFDVYLENMHLTLRRMKICLSKKGTHFLGYPSYPDPNSGADGEQKKWIPFYEFSTEKKIEFENKVYEHLGSLIKGPIVRYKPK